MQIHPNLAEPADGEHCDGGECEAACCPGGIWVDLLHVQRILAHSADIGPQLAEPFRLRDDLWFEDEPLEDADFPSGIALPTRIAPRQANPTRTGCVFLRVDHLCALQVTSEELGLGWPGLKPLDCALYPLTIEAGTVLYDEATTAANPHATCQRHKAGDPKRPRSAVFKTELELALGRQSDRNR